MIFASNGSQLPFDRLVKMLDQAASQINEPVIAQTIKGEYTPEHITTIDLLTPVEFRRYIADARVVVAHAGMGVILSAMELNKPVIVCPRDNKLGEVINSHQLATTAHMKDMGYVYVAEDAETLRDLLSRPDLKPLHTVGHTASAGLINDLTSYIDSL